LQNLTKIEYLYLKSNQLIDISPIGNLRNIKGLDLSSNHINNILPLQKLTKDPLHQNFFSNHIKPL